MAEHGAVSSVLLRMNWVLAAVGGSARVRGCGRCRSSHAPRMGSGGKPSTASTTPPATWIGMRAWWRRSPRGRTSASATSAASGSVVVDVDVHGPVDGRAGFDRAFRAGLMYGWGRNSLCAHRRDARRTTRGRPARSSGRGRQLGAGIDFRGGGGYIIVPTLSQLHRGHHKRVPGRAGQHRARPRPGHATAARTSSTPTRH